MANGGTTDPVGELQAIIGELTTQRDAVTANQGRVGALARSFSDQSTQLNAEATERQQRAARYSQVSGTLSNQEAAMGQQAQAIQSDIDQLTSLADQLGGGATPAPAPTPTPTPDTDTEPPAVPDTPIS